MIKNIVEILDILQNARNRADDAGLEVVSKRISDLADSLLDIIRECYADAQR